MSANGVAEIAYYDEGVVATRSADRYIISLPTPVSAHHQLSIISVLWRVWKSTRNAVHLRDLQWTVHIPDTDELTIPLTAVLSVIDFDLGRTGHTLAIVSGRTDVAPDNTA
jgi:hypothetical protein